MIKNVKVSARKLYFSIKKKNLEILNKKPVKMRLPW